MNAVSQPHHIYKCVFQPSATTYNWEIGLHTEREQIKQQT